MNPSRVCFALLLALLLGAPLAAEESAPDFDELWRVGSLWQVGDNRELVADARQAIIDAGQPGLDYALGRLHVEDTLQVRCLRAVVIGFGEGAIEPLSRHVAHTHPAARRNVAEMLASLDARSASDVLLEQAREEPDVGARLAQLAALSRWEITDAVPLIVEVSTSQIERVRHRAAALLSPFAVPEAWGRLLELLDDETYYVREGASSALRTGTHEGRDAALESLLKNLDRAADEQRPDLIRRLLPVVAACANKAAGEALKRALRHAHGGVRGDAADALVTWAGGAGAVFSPDVATPLRDALNAEYDPFARSAIRSALARLAED